MSSNSLASNTLHTTPVKTQNAKAWIPFFSHVFQKTTPSNPCHTHQNYRPYLLQDPTNCLNFISTPKHITSISPLPPLISPSSAMSSRRPHQSNSTYPHHNHQNPKSLPLAMSSRRTHQSNSTDPQPSKPQTINPFLRPCLPEDLTNPTQLIHNHQNHKL